MKYTTFRSEAKELDTLPGLYELGEIPVKRAVKVDPVGRLHLIAHGRGWTFGLSKRDKHSQDRYYVCISDGENDHLSSSIVKYEVRRDEVNGDWVLALETRSGSIYNVNIGVNPDFNYAAGM